MCWGKMHHAFMQANLVVCSHFNFHQTKNLIHPRNQTSSYNLDRSFYNKIMREALTRANCCLTKMLVNLQ